MLIKLEEKLKGFVHFDDEALPLLVLGFVQQEYYADVKFADRKKWHDIAHQTGGYLCNRIYMTGTVFTPKPSVLEKMRQLSEKYLDSFHHIPASLDGILEYRETIKGWFNADCTFSYPYFEEACYPMDASLELLQELTDEPLPESLSAYTVSEGILSGISHHGFTLFVLGENID